MATPSWDQQLRCFSIVVDLELLNRRCVNDDRSSPSSPVDRMDIPSIISETSSEADSSSSFVDIISTADFLSASKNTTHAPSGEAADERPPLVNPSSRTRPRVSTSLVDGVSEDRSAPYSSFAKTSCSSSIKLSFLADVTVVAWEMKRG